MHSLLLSKNGSVIGEVILEQNEFVLGRGRGCHLRLDDRAISSCHAVIRQSGDVVTIEDADSKNGTLVNGHSITQHQLSDKDMIGIGAYHLEYIQTYGARSSIEQADDQVTVTNPELLGRARAVEREPVGLLGMLETQDLGKCYLLSKVITTIGWSRKNMLVVFRRDLSYFLQKVEGKDPAFLNDVDIKEAEHQLLPGDSIRIGTVTLTFSHFVQEASVG